MGNPVRQRLQEEFKEMLRSKQEVSEFGDKVHDLVVIARDSVLQVLIRIRSRDNEQSIFPNYVHPPESATFEVNDDTKTLTLEDAKEGEWRWQMFHLDTVKNTWSGETKDGVCDLSDVNNYGDFIIELKKKRSLAAFTRKMRKQE